MQVGTCFSASLVPEPGAAADPDEDEREDQHPNHQQHLEQGPEDDIIKLLFHPIKICKLQV
jgi:hypothetical protein